MMMYYNYAVYLVGLVIVHYGIGSEILESGDVVALELYDMDEDSVLNVTEIEALMFDLIGTTNHSCGTVEEIMELSGLNETASNPLEILTVLGNLYPCVAMELVTGRSVEVSIGEDRFLCVPEEHGNGHHLRRLQAHDDDHGHGHGEEEEELVVEVSAGGSLLHCTKQAHEDEGLVLEFSSEMWINTLGAVGISSLMSLVGAAFICQFRGEKTVNTLLLHDAVAFAVGVLLATVCIHMIPATMERAGVYTWKQGICLLAGIMGAFLVEFGSNIWGSDDVNSDGHSHHRRHHHDMCDLEDFRRNRNTGTALSTHVEISPTQSDDKIDGMPTEGKDRAMVVNVIIGDAFHNFSDGLLIAVAFTLCAESGLGWVVTAAIICHELPQELVDFVILLNAGLSVGQALLWNLISSLPSFLGAILVLSLENKITGAQHSYLMSFGTGFLLYLALAELMPRIVQAEDCSRARKLLRVLLTILGVGVIGALQLFHPHCEL